MRREKAEVERDYRRRSRRQARGRRGVRLGTYSEAGGIGFLADALLTGLQRGRVDVERMERAARPDERREDRSVVADAGRRVDRDVSLLECCPPEAVREAEVRLQRARTRRQRAR